ncbi:serine/threonine protein kinase [Corallococcus sp. M34]|uniref:serine/threonine-protein kinase n=1 Tax=Citreicoccus inhibens TaxID=2849499 RepID=UPI001C2220B1|nr:serine/threonine-protein kinase [Citreicoccus inhibens]MBU8897449.1 serine/threonine protein kinase [Citreicoccus inhibens]
MERQRSMGGHAAEMEAARSCVACGAVREALRCGHCGAADAPGGYCVQRVLSQSAHGRVYLALDASGRRVALKELLFALVPGPEQLDAFEREAAVLRSLSHPDIPRFLASFQEGTGVGTRLYLAQEYLEGESLLQRLEREPLREDEAWSLAEQVLETLDSLHQRRPALLHRDVKPANLILRPGGRVALVDFGSARHLAREVTHGSTLVGTFGYMPPEQLGGTVEPSSDLYALGATLVHALSGRSPADLLDERLRLAFDADVRVSASLRTFLHTLVAPRRSERFGSAATALERLRSLRAPPGPAPVGAVVALQPAPVAPLPVEPVASLAAEPEGGLHAASAQATQEAVPPVRRNALRWVLLGAATVVGLGVALTTGYLVLRPRAESPLPAPPAVAPSHGGRPVAPLPADDPGGEHRHFRTPWQPGAGSR